MQPTILTPGDGPAAEVLNASGQGGFCLVCEHASAVIPPSLGDLGLASERRYSHAVWDPGALNVARAISAALDAPLVAARFSRLVYDCNRPPSATDAMPALSEVIEVPGNRDLTPEARAQRTAEIYAPFRALLSATLDRFAAPPVMVTLHSFTPVWHGIWRPVELGLIHDADPSLATAMLASAPADVTAALNAPYSAADGVTHTLREHATPRGLRNVMVEIRNDLIADADGVDRFARMLTGMLGAALNRESAA